MFTHVNPMVQNHHVYYKCIIFIICMHCLKLIIICAAVKVRVWDQIHDIVVYVFAEILKGKHHEAVNCISLR